MNSASLVAGSPAQGAEPAQRAPTDWRTSAMQKRIRRRYAAERRFRLLGLFAVVMSAAFLAFLLITMIGNGVRGFQRTEVTLPIDFARLALPVTREQLNGPGADLALAGTGLQGAVGRAAEQGVRGRRVRLYRRRGVADGARQDQGGSFAAPDPHRNPRPRLDRHRRRRAWRRQTRR